jgi:hypothetical protein
MKSDPAELSHVGEDQRVMGLIKDQVIVFFRAERERGDSKPAG